MHEKEPSHELLATGVGGVLYPPHSLDSRAFDTGLIQELCLEADDIWLKFMEVLAETKVAWAVCKIPVPEEIKESQQNNLRSKNIGKDNNDIFIQNVMRYFQINDSGLWKA